MPETEASLRDRALAAWHERHQEMQVEKERRTAAAALRALREGTRLVLSVLADGTAPGEFTEADIAICAEQAGLAAADPVETADGWQVDFLVDHVRLRYTLGYETRLEVVGECPDCGGDTIFGYQIKTLTGLGIALDEQMKNPKGMHRCPPADDLNDDPLPEVTPIPDHRDVDPAHVLLDALQSYIHAAVDYAVRNHGRPMPEPAIDDEETF